MAAMAHDPRTAGEIGDYGARVDTWLKQRLSAQD
jgi:hypothetical protein